MCGQDGRRDPARTAQVIRELDADIIALQEVTSQSNDDRESNHIRYLADAIGFQAVAGPTLQRLNGHYGNALLTRYQILAVRRLDLSVPGREPRGALDVDLHIAGKTVQVITIHFGLRAAERRVQTRRLLATLSEQRPVPLVVLGDINEWFPCGRSLYWLKARLGNAPAPRTFPAFFPASGCPRPDLGEAARTAC